MMETLKEGLNEAVKEVIEELPPPTSMDMMDLVKNQLTMEKFRRLTAEEALVAKELEEVRRELAANEQMLRNKYKIDPVKDKVNPQTGEIIRHNAK